MRRLFAEPETLVYGDETAEQARARFQGGINQILAGAAPEENIVVIAHGTVIALYAAHYNQLDRYDLWRRLGMPALLEFNLPDMRLTMLIEDAGKV